MPSQPSAQNLLIDNRAVGGKVLVEGDSSMAAAQQPLERGLAQLKRRAPQILAVELQQIKGAERDGVIVLPIADEIEHRKAVRVDRNRFTVQHARAHRQGSDRLDNEREAVGEVEAVAGGKPPAIAVAVSDDAKAVVLDFVNPCRARWRLFCRPGQTRIEAPDSAIRLTQR